MATKKSKAKTTQTQEPTSAITPQILWKRSLFQTSKRPSRRVTAHMLDKDRFVKMIGYVNVTDQDHVLAAHLKAREGLKDVTIKGIPMKGVVFERDELLKLTQRSTRGSATDTIVGSMERLQSMTISHNLYGPYLVFSMFEAAKYDEEKKQVIFAFSRLYQEILNEDPTHLKALPVNGYFELKRPLSKIIYPVMRQRLDADLGNAHRKYTMRALLEAFNKQEWISQAIAGDNARHYVRVVCERDLFPAFDELKEKGFFQFAPVPGSDKYDLETPWIVTRLYEPSRLEEIRQIEAHIVTPKS